MPMVYGVRDSARALGMAGFATVAVFVGVLGLGLAYAWRQGALARDARD